MAKRVGDVFIVVVVSASVLIDELRTVFVTAVVVCDSITFERLSAAIVAMPATHVATKIQNHAMILQVKLWP